MDVKEEREEDAKEDGRSMIQIRSVQGRHGRVVGRQKLVEDGEWTPKGSVTSASCPSWALSASTVIGA